MSEILVKNKICLECGVESRPGSLFCYNCGSSVSRDIDGNGEDSNGDGQFDGELITDKSETDVEAEIEVDEPEEDLDEPQTSEVLEEVDNLENAAEEEEEEDSISEETKKPNLEESELAKPKIEFFKESVAEEKLSENSLEVKTIESKPPEDKKKRLRSASALRRKSKTLNTKKVEVIWEERETAPNLLFIIVSMALVVLALLLVYLAMYLR